MSAKAVRNNRVAPMRWAQEMLSREFVIFDCETTGLDASYDRIVQIGVVDHIGNVLVDTFVRPGMHIPADASRIHGITDAMVASAPIFSELYPKLYVLQGKPWVIYNVNFDLPFLRNECRRHGLHIISPAKTEEGMPDLSCAMEMYAEFYGDWSDYHGDYRWQKLTSACRQQGVRVDRAHSAADDCLLTLALIRKMAEG